MRRKIVEAATISSWEGFAAEGGLISYGTSINKANRLLGGIVRTIKGHGDVVQEIDPGVGVVGTEGWKTEHSSHKKSRARPVGESGVSHDRRPTEGQWAKQNGSQMPGVPGGDAKSIFPACAHGGLPKGSHPLTHRCISVAAGRLAGSHHLLAAQPVSCNAATPRQALQFEVDPSIQPSRYCCRPQRMALFRTAPRHNATTRSPLAQ
jgi:hypothetical protein